MKRLIHFVFLIYLGTISCQTRDYVLYQDFYIVNSKTDGAIPIISENPEQIIVAAFGRPDSILSLTDSINCLYYKDSYFKHSYKPVYNQAYLIKDSNFYIVVDSKTDFKVGDSAKKLIKHFEKLYNPTRDSLKVNFAYNHDKELIKDKSYIIFYLSNNKIISILCKI